MALVAAVRLVYGDRRYRAAAVLVAVASIAILAWSSQVITYFPQGAPAAFHRRLTRLPEVRIRTNTTSPRPG